MKCTFECSSEKASSCLRRVRIRFSLSVVSIYLHNSYQRLSVFIFMCPSSATVCVSVLQQQTVTSTTLPLSFFVPLSLLLCISTSERVIHTPFAGHNQFLPAIQRKNESTQEKDGKNHFSPRSQPAFGCLPA